MRWRDEQTREELPIDSKLEYLLDLLGKHKVLICEAETGAGKTTRIPQAALLSDPNLKILMTQPRRNACRWIGQRIASELGCKPGQAVGWRLAGEEPKTSRKTRLELMVDQTLINRIRHRSGALPEGLIIIDEAHERSLSIDLLLGLVKEKLDASPKTRVLITSATIDTEKFSRFFNKAPIVRVKGRCFPVSEEIFPLSRGEHHTEGAARAAIVVLERFLQKKLVVPGKHQSQHVVNKGTVLVLLPGKEDIASVMRTLLENVSHHQASNQIQVLQCHGNSATEEQNFVQKAVPRNTLRFVCCTELLRTSVTLPETVGVIDSLQVKRRITNSNGVACLDKVTVSKAEANQAKGRAGRTAPGFYIPVSFESEYDHLPEWPQPAILRELVTHVALQIAAIECSIRHFSFIDAPPADKIELAVSRLTAISALTKKEIITETGRSLLQFPLEPELAMILLTADKLNVLAEAIIVTASLEDNSFFIQGKTNDILLVDQTLLQKILEEPFSSTHLPRWVSRKNERFEVKCGDPHFPHTEGARWVRGLLRQAWTGESQSDFVAIVRAYRAFKSEEQQCKRVYRNTKTLEKHLNNWCFARGLNLKKFRLTDDKILQIKESLALSPLKLKHEINADRHFDETALTKAIISGKTDHIAYSDGDTEFSSKLGNFQLSHESTCPTDSLFVLVNSLRKVHIRSRGYTPSHRLLADYAAPVKTAWLNEIAPQLCTKKRMQDEDYAPETDAVTETEISYFNGTIELGRKKVLATNKQATRSIARWLANQCLYSSSRHQTINSELNDAIIHNINQQKCANKLNHRAGQPCFKIYSSEELVEIFVNALPNVTHVHDLTSSQIQAIRLPELDKHLVEKIMADHPSNIKLISLNLDVKIEYRDSPLPPLITIEEENVTCNWLKFLEENPQLPNGRNLDIKINRKFHPDFTIRWDSCGRANLPGVNISSLSFSQSKAPFLPTTQTLDKLPYFLLNNAFDKKENLNRALDLFCHYSIEPSQLKVIQWSLAMQIIRISKKKNTPDYLEILRQHAFMKKEDYLARMSANISGFFSPLAAYFSGNTKKQSSSESLSIDQTIEIAITSITTAEKSSGEHIFHL